MCTANLMLFFSPNSFSNLQHDFSSLALVDRTYVEPGWPIRFSYQSLSTTNTQGLAQPKSPDNARNIINKNRELCIVPYKGMSRIKWRTRARPTRTAGEYLGHILIHLTRRSPVSSFRLRSNWFSPVSPLRSSGIVPERTANAHGSGNCT